jgi:hypothetical protein
MLEITHRVAAHAVPSYVGHPSCTTCKVDYLGEGTCGACLFVANLCADSLLVLKQLSDLVDGIERHYSHEMHEYRLGADEWDALRTELKAGSNDIR